MSTQSIFLRRLILKARSRPVRSGLRAGRARRHSTSRHVHSEAVQASALHPGSARSEEHTSELQSLMRISYAVFCLKKKKKTNKHTDKCDSLAKEMINT